MLSDGSHGLLTRFPDLRIALIENGAEWVPHLLELWADIYRKMPQAFGENPIEAFTRNVSIAPFHEDNIGAILQVLPAERLLFGSDYPHPEGLAEPCSYVDHLPRELPETDVRAIMGGNLARLMKVDVAA